MSWSAVLKGQPKGARATSADHQAEGHGVGNEGLFAPRLEQVGTSAPPTPPPVIEPPTVRQPEAPPPPRGTRRSPRLAAVEQS